MKKTASIGANQTKSKTLDFLSKEPPPNQFLKVAGKSLMSFVALYSLGPSNSTKSMMAPVFLNQTLESRTTTQQNTLEPMESENVSNLLPPMQPDRRVSFSLIKDGEMWFRACGFVSLPHRDVVHLLFQAFLVTVLSSTLPYLSTMGFVNNVCAPQSIFSNFNCYEWYAANHGVDAVKYLSCTRCVFVGFVLTLVALVIRLGWWGLFRILSDHTIQKLKYTPVVVDLAVLVLVSLLVGGILIRDHLFQTFVVAILFSIGTSANSNYQPEQEQTLRSGILYSNYVFAMIVGLISFHFSPLSFRSPCGLLLLFKSPQFHLR